MADELITMNACEAVQRLRDGEVESDMRRAG